MRTLVLFLLIMPGIAPFVPVHAVQAAQPVRVWQLRGANWVYMQETLLLGTVIPNNGKWDAYENNDPTHRYGFPGPNGTPIGTFDTLDQAKQTVEAYNP